MRRATGSAATHGEPSLQTTGSSRCVAGKHDRAGLASRRVRILQDMARNAAEMCCDWATPELDTFLAARPNLCGQHASSHVISSRTGIKGSCAPATPLTPSAVQSAWVPASSPPLMQPLRQPGSPLSPRPATKPKSHNFTQPPSHLACILRGSSKT